MKIKKRKRIEEKKINWLIDEYKLLKTEESQIFSFEFVILSIWISFIGVLLGEVVTRYEKMKACPNLITVDLMLFLLIVVFLPMSSSFFGVIWLDLSCRFIKEAHYLFTLENKIRNLLGSDDIFRFENYILEQSSQSKKRRLQKLLPINYVLYCLVLGLLIVIPIIVVVLSILLHSYLQLSHSVLGYIAFALNELFTLFFSIRYVQEMLRYAKEKKSAK